MNIVFVGLENQCSRTTFMIAKSRRQGVIAAIVQYHTVGVDRYLELICRISDIIWCGKDTGFFVWGGTSTKRGD